MIESLPAVGAFLQSDSCSFTVWAPDKKNVRVILHEKKGPAHAMKKDTNGYWFVNISGITAGTQYFYQLDDHEVLPDPASLSQPNGVHEASAVPDRLFHWRDHDWKGLPLKDLVIYELHVGTFTASHDFNGVISKLDYLQNLGINAIEIMPVAQFTGNRNWGYDGVYPFAVQHSYGGIHGLKNLVNEAHQRGIAVILDVVYNHQGPEGNYLSAFGPYFTDKYKTPWGKAINFDDAWCDGVRNFYWQNALMWLDEFRIDGLRMDAVHAIWDFSALHFVEELTKKVRALEKQTGRKKILIAEFDLNNPRYIYPSEIGGYGMDGQWIDEFHHALHAVVTGETNGYYEDFGEVRHLEKSYRDSYVYSGEFSKHRKKKFGTLPRHSTFDQFVVFAQNHDQIGNRMLGDRLAQHLSFEGLKLVAATYLLSPNVPMLFMGEEYGEKNPFQYFISHTDEKLVEIVRKGRKEEFSYFNWQGEVPDPQSEKTFNECVLSWNYQTTTEASALLKYYQYLINFRKTRKAMKGHSRDTLKVFPAIENKIILLQRDFEGDCIFIAFNFSKVSETFQLPVHCELNRIFDSSTSEWRGPGEVTSCKIEPYQNITMNAQSAVIFER